MRLDEFYDVSTIIKESFSYEYKKVSRVLPCNFKFVYQLYILIIDSTHLLSVHL